MMNHLGTVFIALTSAILAMVLYPELGLLFLVSPVACAGLLFFMCRLNPNWIDHNEARGLTCIQKTASTRGVASAICEHNAIEKYVPPAPARQGGVDGQGVLESAQSNIRRSSADKRPSFNFGCMDGEAIQVVALWSKDQTVTSLKADSPLRILCDPILLLFLAIVFVFNLANSSVLPLVMQTLAVGSGPAGMVLAGMCMVVSQSFMALSAKLCGAYSTTYGRKPLFLIGLVSLPIRCSILALILEIRGEDESEDLSVLDCLILSTQALGGVGLGVFGTMYILVTSDISGGTGRFSLTLGLTTAATSIGCTVAGYAGEVLAEDLGYQQVFGILAALSCIPPLLYLVAMPETLPPLLRTKKKGEIEQGMELSNTPTIEEESEMDHYYNNSKH